LVFYSSTVIQVLSNMYYALTILFLEGRLRPGNHIYFHWPWVWHWNHN